MALDESTRAQFKPFLNASLAMIGPVALDLMVANIGKGSAENVKIKFRVLEKSDTERKWEQELMLPETNQKFFIPIGEKKTEHSTEYFENNQTTIEFEWECMDILDRRHSGTKRINVTEFVKQMNVTQARYEESFEDELSDSLKAVSKNTERIVTSLNNIHRDLQPKDEEK